MSRFWPTAHFNNALETNSGPLLRHLQPRLAPEPPGPISTHSIVLALQEDLDASIAISRILTGQLAHGGEDRSILVLYGRIAYEEVLRLVIEGLRPCWGDEALAEHTVTKGAISQARREVGAGVLKQLYEEQVKPIGTPGMPGVWYRGHRLMALDRSALDMPDEAGNAERFGYATTPRGEAGFPQLRFVALVECGTHVLCHARLGPYAQAEEGLAAGGT